MRNKIGIICMSLGIVLVIAALTLFGRNRLEDARAGRVAESQASQLWEYIGEQKAERGTSSVSDLTDEESGSSVAEVDGYTYLGILSIPALGLELPVMADWDYARLKLAPCRYAGSIETDDLVVAAHNYSRHFGALKKLVPGDAVYFTGVDGYRHSYEAERIETLAPTAVEEMTGGEFALTLFTCTYGGQDRVTVRCRHAS